MTIPPAGPENSRAIAQYLDDLVRESCDDPRRTQFLSQYETDVNFYLGDQWEADLAPDGVIRCLLNRVQNVVLALSAIQAGEPPRVTFTPRETGDPPLTFLDPTSQGYPRIVQMLGALGIPPTEDALPKVVADLIRQNIQMNNQSVAMGVPEAQFIPDDVLVDVTDATTAAALQTVYDGIWEASNGQYSFLENVLYKNIGGWQPTLLEWDDEYRKAEFTNTHPKQIFMDSLNSDPRKMHYVVFDYPRPVDEAIFRWPKLIEQITAAKRAGRIISPGSHQYEQGELYDQQFERDMVNTRTAWIRYQRFPLSPEEAVASGMVLQTMIDDVDGPEDEEGIPSVLERPALINPETSEEMDQAHPAWPMRTGVRQIMVIAGEVVDDRECEHSDIPVAFNKNVPIPFSPYGQSEPERLRSLQTAINNLLSSFVTHHAYNAFPPEVVPESVVERLGDAVKRLRSRPGERVVVPDSLLQQLGSIQNIVATLPTGEIPSTFWNLLNILIELIDKEGNLQQVSQGDAKSTWSGTTVQALQSANSQIIMGKSAFTEHYIQYLARLLVHCIVTRLGPDDWARYLTKYPPQAIQALFDRAKSIDVDIKVAIRSASGSAEQQETQQLVALKQVGVPISDETIMERYDIDADGELMRNVQYQKKIAALMGPMVAGNTPASAGQPAGQNQQQVTGQG